MSTLTKEMTFYERVTHLVKREVALKKKMIYSGLTAIVILLVISQILLSIYPWIIEPFAPVIYSFTFTIFTYAGYAFSSIMFNELHTSATAPQFLTLPATAFEKLTAAWLVSYVAYTVVGVLALIILHWITGHGGQMLTGTGLTDFYVYTVTQSIFLFGGVYFKKNNFLATVVALMVLFLGFSLFVLAINTFFPGAEQNLFFISSEWKFITLFGGLPASTLTSLFFLGLAYKKLKNKQIA